MKELRQNDYKNEILRFCRVLTQVKYEEEFDKTIKRLISENLDELAFFRAKPATNRKGELVERILGLCKGLVECEYGTESDQDTKKEIAKCLAEISEYEAERQAKREEKAYKNRITNLSLCLYGGSYGKRQ